MIGGAYVIIRKCVWTCLSDDVSSLPLFHLSRQFFHPNTNCYHMQMKASVEKMCLGLVYSVCRMTSVEYPLLLGGNLFKHAQMTSDAEEDADWLKNR